MLIKFNSEDPVLIQAITLLRLKYRTSATSKAVKRSIYDFHHMEIENEILKGHNESMSAEIDRLRDLLELYRSTQTGTKWRYLR